MSIHKDRRVVSLDGTQQIAMVASLMALELDPANPHHAALLEGMERALFRLRNEKGDSNAQRSRIDPAVQIGDLCDQPVLRRTDLGVDISLPDRLCRIADLACEIDDLKNGLSDYARKAIKHPRHATAHLLLTRVLPIAPHTCDRAAVAVRLLRRHLGLFAKAEIGQGLLAALAERLGLLRRVDLSESHLHLLVVGTEGGQRVTVSDADHFAGLVG